MFTWIRIIGAVAVIVFALWGVGVGLWQQSPGLPDDQADCSYRVELMRARLLALMDRSPSRADTGTEADEDFANLLRETHAACGDASPDLLHKLERIDDEHARERERRRQSAAARAELSALEGFPR
ncbi:hypothetical protein ENSA5_34870 [Enhygromyxa salina]|uniref:Uncharacterized protein n=1 Tax=Enhygromyxa salina TaxID=215803 RepID=A0A2S9XW94_9BACT|nr:hypothetical protein ENSA5_34870 [Enhygromyxa salina]